MSTFESIRPARSLAWLAAMSAWCAVGCAPDVPSEAPPAFVEFEFDPAASPAKSFEPTSLVVNERTGLIDLSAAGIEVPALDAANGCEGQSAMPVAQCEFYQYLETLDGFPTLATGTTPASAALDLATVKLPHDLFIYDLQRERAVSDVDVSFDASSGELQFEARAGWDVGTSYLVGVRGYGHGVASTQGAPAVSSIIYALLKSPGSLSCGATRAEQVDVTCEAYGLLAGDARFASLPAAAKHDAIAENLLQLEQLRTYYLGQSEHMPVDIWATLERSAEMPKDEVAIAWFFNTHSASVVELNPARDLVPAIVSGSEIRLVVKGTLDPDSLRAFSLENPDGTVFLLDVDKLAQNVADPRALPPFEPRYADGRIFLKTTDPGNSFIEGDTYALLLTNELTDAQGAPIVASPLSVLLRTRGALVDAEGVSQISGFSAADAQLLEQGRSQFARLFDDPLIQSATMSAGRPAGLSREQVAYLYGFAFVNP